MPIRVMNQSNLRNAILGVSAIVGLAVAALVEYEKDPARPFILLVGVLVVLKVNLEYLLGLPMAVTYPLAMPDERGKRYRVLVVSWLLLLFMVYGFITW